MEAGSPNTPSGRPAHVLVVANETVAGRRLMEAIERRAALGPIRVTVICPQNEPHRGFVIFDHTVRSAAQIRLEQTLDRLKELGIEASGEVMDPDPFLATQDALRLWGADEIIISTLPYPRSGFLRRDLIGRIRNFAKIPVEHVEVDLTDEPFKHALVVANKTIGGRPLIDELERRSTEAPHRFTVIAPQDGADAEATKAAQERLDQTLRELRQAGLDVTGYVTHPDPLTAIVNAHQFDRADEIVISTLPSYSSNWLRGDLPNRARRATGVPVEHVTSDVPTPVELTPSGAH
jgi:hypothetical protein